MSTPSGSNTKPLGYSYLISEEILHGPVAADPSAPYLPAPEVYDDFVFAMGIGWPNDIYAPGVDPQEIPIQQTVVGRSGVFAHGLEQSGTTDSERKPGWTYNVPEGTSVRALTAKAFAAFNNYGPIPTDTEDNNLVWSWAPGDSIVKERKVFFYQTTVSHDGRDADFDLVMALYGAPTASPGNEAWIYPEKNGETVRGLLKRGPDQWVALFNLFEWMNENGELIQQAILLIATIAISIVTVGLAVPAMLGFYVAMQAVLAGMKMLAVAIQTGDVGLAIQAIIKVGQGMQGASSSIAPEGTQAAVDDIKKKFDSQAAPFVAWGKSFAVPITKAYDQAKALVGQGGDAVTALVKIASEQGRSFPLIDGDYWKNAFARVNVGAAVQVWATKAQNLEKEQLADFINSVPWYAREAAGLGAAVRAAEIAQNSIPIGGGFHFGPIVQAPTGKGMMQLKPELAALIRANWAKPDPSLKARAGDIAAFVKNPGSTVPAPQFIDVSTPAKVFVGAGLAAVVFLAMKDYAFGKLFDKLLDKVIS